MSATTFELREAENKKKGMRVTIGLHIAVIILLLFPFLKFQPEEPKSEAFVVLDFTKEFNSASAKSSTKKAAPTKGEKKKAVKKEVKKPKPKPKPRTKPAAKKKPILKSKEKTKKIETKPNTAPKKVEAPIKEPTPEVTEVTEEVAEEVVEEKVSETTTTEVGDAEAAGGAKTSGNTDGNGDGTQGSSDSGKSKTDGVADAGEQGMDFSGNGIFNRKVIYRADIAKVIKEEGKIVINLCINRDGRVVYAKNNKDLSTIKSSNVIRKAISATTSYRYAKDYTAPEKQCGKLTFNIIDIEEEE